MSDDKQDDLMSLLTNLMHQLPQDQLAELANLASKSENNTLPIEGNGAKAIYPTKNKWGQIYSEELVVMQNRMLHSVSNLTLNERRLVLLLATTVRGAVEKNPYQKTFSVTGEEFAELYNISKKKCYDVLFEASKNLYDKSISFWDFDADEVQKKKKREVDIHWITKADYQWGDGYINIDLHDDVIEMLCIFDKHGYTQNEKEWFSKLGSYGLVLLQLIAAKRKRQENLTAYIEGKIAKGFEAEGFDYHSIDKSFYTIKYLRSAFNCLDRYDRWVDFKRYVIDVGIKEIHTHTPIRVHYEAIKVGRTVNELVFGFYRTDQDAKAIDQQQSPVNQWKNIKLSEKQLEFFSRAIAERMGDDVDEVKELLLNPVTQSKYYNVLAELEFKPSAWYDAEELELLEMAHAQKLAKQRYEKQKELERLAEEKRKAEEERQRRIQAMTESGWFEAEAKYNSLDESTKAAVVGRYIDRLDAEEGKNIKKKLKMVKQFDLGIGTIIEHHDVFISVLNDFENE